MSFRNSKPRSNVAPVTALNVMLRGLSNLYELIYKIIKDLHSSSKLGHWVSTVVSATQGVLENICC